MTKKTNNNSWRIGRKCTFENMVHFIFLTKHRNVLNDKILSRMEEIFDETCKQMRCQLLVVEGGSGHVHLLVSFPPTLAISTLAGKLKGKSSYILMREFSDEIKGKTNKNHFWSPSYCAVSHSNSPLTTIKKFLLNDQTVD